MTEQSYHGYDRKAMERKEDKEDKVIFYSGYKGEETPRAVLAGGGEYPVEEVLWRKRIVDRTTGKTVEIFACRVAGQKIEIRRDETGRTEIVPPGILS